MIATLFVAAPLAAANQPAQGQYRLHVPSSGAPQGGSPTPSGNVDSGGSSSNTAVIVLLVGAAAVAGSGAYVAWRRRRAGTGKTT